MVQLLSLPPSLTEAFHNENIGNRIASAPTDAFLVFVHSDRDASPASSGGAAGICMGK